MAKEQATGTLVDETTRDATDRGIRCRACDAAITERRFAHDVDGARRHVFQNPVGLVYEIICFARADGCISAGEPTPLATWFDGHAWSFAICRRCGAHIGWGYWQDGELRFWGLIADRLHDERE